MADQVHTPALPPPTKRSRSMMEPPKLSEEDAEFDPGEQTPRPPSPAPSGVSLKSDRSMMEPPKLSDTPVDLHSREPTRRPPSPSPSGVSLKSDRSMMEPPKLSDTPVDLDPREPTPRPASPSPSGVSLKSDRSMMEPPKLSDTPVDLDPRQQTRRPPSPSPSGVSLKSDRSMMEPPKLSDVPVDLHPREQTRRPASPSPSGVSLKSDRSMMEPPKLSDTPVDLHPSGVSLKSDRSMKEPPKLSDTPVDLDPRRDFSTDSVARTSGISCDDNLTAILTHHKTCLKKQLENIRERVLTPSSQEHHVSIDTKLCVTEGDYEGVDGEQSASTTQSSEDKQISYNDIFEPLPGWGNRVRAVLTKGAPCIGKTVLVQKFINDWADGNANQDIDVVIVLPLRLLNLIKDQQYSLQEMLRLLYPNLQDWMDCVKFEDYQILFIFFALDECNLPLNFQQNRSISDVAQKATVDTLVTSLIQGSLVPNARIWITSRHVASNQIPPDFIDKVTEVRGFTDSQKEEYFKKKISDESRANEILSHIKASRSLHSMCRLPVFSWIAATVLQQIVGVETNYKIPTTLTEMFVHFLLIQTSSRHKYQASSKTASQDALKSQQETIMKLSELAFKQLEKGNVMFSENELKECGLDITEALVSSGLCADTLKGQCDLFGKMYTFVHITLQEFLAALYVFVSYVNQDVEALKPLFRKKFNISVGLGGMSLRGISQEGISLEDLLKNAVNRALESKSGHLDLFVRFLHGMAMESNQKLLQGLLTHPESSPRGVSNPESLKTAIRNLKEIKRQNISPDRWINLLYCLVEMHDSSVYHEAEAFRTSETGTVKRLKRAHCSALANMFLTSVEPIEELNLKKFKTSVEGRRRLVPAVRCCRKALFADCRLTENCCEVVALALESAHSHLRELDMSHNDLQKTEKRLLGGLQSPHCRLEALRLAHCKLSRKSCEVLAPALQSAALVLRKLDLSDNNLQDSVKHIFMAIANPNSKLESLSVAGCKVTAVSCKDLVPVLRSDHSPLRELDLSRNRLQDAGVEDFAPGLGSPNCCLETLRLSACDITGKGCESLASALRENPAYLRELDLTDNPVEEPEVKPLMKLRDSRNSALKTLTW